jgi:hypothetical protein
MKVKDAKEITGSHNSYKQNARPKLQRFQPGNAKPARSSGRLRAQCAPAVMH